MTKFFVFLIVVLSLLVSSCTGKRDSSQGETAINNNEIQLNINGNNPPLNLEPSTPVQPGTPLTSQNDFFISGRTELLSLASKDYLAPEGFSIGAIFMNHSSTVEEKNIINTCISFFDSFKNEKMLEFVQPSRVLEIQDYCEYFLYDTLLVDKYLLGRPHIKGTESHLKMIFYPDFTTAFVYLSKENNRWLISGFEVDLRAENQIDSDEKWAPTVKPPIFGNY